MAIKVHWAGTRTRGGYTMRKVTEIKEMNELDALRGWASMLREKLENAHYKCDLDADPPEDWAEMEERGEDSTEGLCRAEVDGEGTAWDHGELRDLNDYFADLKHKKGD